MGFFGYQSDRRLGLQALYVAATGKGGLCIHLAPRCVIDFVQILDIHSNFAASVVPCYGANLVSPY